VIEKELLQELLPDPCVLYVNLAAPTDEDDEQGNQSEEEVDVDFEPDAELAGVVQQGGDSSKSSDRNKGDSNRNRK